MMRALALMAFVMLAWNAGRYPSGSAFLALLLCGFAVAFAEGRRS